MNEQPKSVAALNADARVLAHLVKDLAEVVELVAAAAVGDAKVFAELRPRVEGLVSRAEGFVQTFEPGSHPGFSE